MSAFPLIAFRGVVKTYAGLRPLRIKELAVARTDRLAIRGLDAQAAEMFVLLVTGASLPDEGEITIDGRSTRDITTDTEWLASLDRFGIVTHRAVLIDALTVAANLALPMTISIDPLSEEMRARVEGEAALAGLAADRLDRKVGELSEEERLRLHLARASANRPDLILLEHPTSRLQADTAPAAIGQTLKSMADARGFGWLALTEDAAFGGASGATALALDPATGTIAPEKRGWRRWI